MGGLDTQGYLSFGTPEEVRSAVREVISIMGKGGGYIAAPSHTITIPAENRQAMIEAIAEVNALGHP
jgi:uroporphyrinogen decarboxylase